mgnify:CR=1 FL=1
MEQQIDTQSLIVNVPGTHEAVTARIVNENNSYIFISGMIGLNPETDQLENTLQEQTKRMFNNIQNVLKLAGSSLDRVVKINLFVTSEPHLAEVEKEYSNWFTNSLPARTRVVVKALPKGALVESEVIALADNKTKVKTLPGERIPKALGPYVMAKRLRADSNFVVLSGSIGLNPVTGTLADDLTEQTRQTLANIKNLLARSHSSMGNIIKTTVYLTDMADFQTMNTEYAKWFEEGKYPCRSTVAVKALPKGAKVEIDVIAVEDEMPSFYNIQTDDFPKPIGPYTVTKRLAPNTPLMYISGIIGEDKEGGIPESVGEQTQLALQSIKEILAKANASFDNVVKALVYLTDMGDFAAMNDVYKDFFPQGNEPTRVCVAVMELPKKAKVQIDLVVALADK